MANRIARRYLRIHFRTLLVAVIAALLMPAGSQAQRVTVVGSRQPEVFLPAPRELRRELQQAEADLQQGSYVDAITRLDLILGGGTGEDVELSEDYFLPAEGDDDALQSLRAKALQLISLLPPEGQQAYELQFGTEARLTLEAAIADRDTDALVQISRRYAATRAGQEATMLLGRDRIQQGRPLEAVLHFQRLYESPSARQRFGAELRLLLATSFALSGRNDDAVAVLKTDGEAVPEALSIAGKPVDTPIAADNPLDWLVARTGPLRTSLVREDDQWQLFGGSERRVASRDVDMPLQSLRWDVDFTYRDDEEEIIQRQAKARGSQPSLPALHPLVTDGWVLMRSTDQLWGVELKSGKRVWEYPWSAEQDTAGALLGDPYGARGSQRTQLLKSRVWDDALYGQLSSDGAAVYLLNRLPNSYTVGSNRGAPSNELVALSLEKEGYSLWVVGGDDGQYEPQLAGVFFLGPPLPIRDKLYCLGELNSEIRLMVLNKADGRLAWSQQLAQVDERRIATISGVRRKAGLNASHADGILICPTSVGGIVAVDIASRSFLWGFRYQKRTVSGSRYRRGTDHWRDNWSTVAAGKVIVTPFDSNEMYCLDLLTGQPHWSQPRSRGSSLYVAGVHRDHIVLVGSDEVSTVDIHTGEDGWTVKLDGRSAGRGVQSERYYFLATTKPELIKIDLQDGTIVETMATHEPLGNLVAYQDQIIAQNPLRVQAFYQREKLEQRVDDMLAENPQAAWALEHKALLLLESGRREEGLATLQTAIEHYPQGSAGESLAAKQLLLKTSLEMLRDNAPGSTELAVQIEPLLREFPDKRDEFLRVMTVNLQRAGHVEAAFRKNLDLFLSEQSTVTHSVLGGIAELKSVSQQRRIRNDRWHRALFHDLWKQADENQRAAMAEVIRQQVARAQPQELPRLVDVLQDTHMVDHLLIDIFKQELARQVVSPVVESRLQRLTRSADADLAAQAVALLAQLYRQANRNAAAASQLRLLESTFGDIKLSDGVTGRQFAEAEMKRDASLLKYLQLEQAWPVGMVDKVTLSGERGASSSMRPKTRFDALNRLHSIATQSPLQPPPYGLELVYDQLGHALQGRDGMGQVHPLADLSVALPGVRPSELELKTNGHLIVAVRRGSVVAINGLTGQLGSDESILWTDKVESATPYAGTGNGPPIHFGEMGLQRTAGAPGRKIVELGPVNDRGVVFRRYGDLVCLDPQDGSQLWVRNDIPMGAEVWGDDEHVFVHVPGAQPGLDGNARVFSMLNGREVESRPVADQRQRIRAFGRYVLSWTYDLAGDVDGNVDHILNEILLAKNNVEKIREETAPEDARKVLVNRIQLNDMFDRERSYLWAHTFEFGARATFVGEDEIAVYEPEQAVLTVFSITSGKVLLQQTVQVGLVRIDRVHVEKRAGYYVLRLSQDTNGRVDRKLQFQSPNPVVKLQNMEIFAFSPAGELAWSKAARLQHFMPADFPGRDVPILVFLRRLEEGAPKRQLQTLVLDVRDGSKIHEHIGTWEGSTFHVRGNQGMKQVLLRTPAAGAAWNLSFTDQPRSSPEPYDYATSAENSTSGAGVLGSLFKAIAQPFRGPAAEDEPESDE